MAQKNIPTYEQKEQVKAQVPMIDFQQAMANLGASTNVLSSYGSKLAQTASNQFSEKMGYEMGQNPSGDLLPALTESDKHFAAAYTTQAQATLGNQLNAMMMSAQTDLAKAPKLTPQMIANFNEQMTRGAEKIISQAPTGVKEYLDNHFKNTMIRTSGQLNTKMAQQQISDTKQKLNQSITASASNIYEAVLAGQTASAQQELQRQTANIDAQVELGYMTPKLAELSRKQLHQAYLNGQYTNAALKARESGQIDKFFYDLGSKKPDDLSFSEWTSVIQSVSGYIHRLENLKTQERQKIISDIQTKMTVHGVYPTAQELDVAEQELTPVQFNNLKSMVYKAQTTERNKLNAIYDTLENANNPQVMAQKSPKDINEAFMFKYNSTLEAYPERDPNDVKAVIAQQFDSPIPILVKEVNMGLQSNDPVRIVNESNVVQKVHANNAQKLPLAPQSQSMLELFKQFSGTEDQVKAAQHAHDIVFPSNPTVSEHYHKITSGYVSKNLATSSQKINFANDVFPNKVSKLPNAEFHIRKAISVFQNYMNLTGANAEISKKLTEQYFGANYGTSTLGGYEKEMFQPPHKVAGLPQDSEFIFKHQMSQELDKQFVDIKKLYKQGVVNEWYEVTQRPEFSKTASAIDMYNIKQDIESFAEAEGAIRGIKKSGPLRVKVHYRAKGIQAKEYNVDIDSTSLVYSKSIADVGQVVGPYTFVFTDDKGNKVGQPNNFNQSVNGMMFSPNITQAREMYQFFNTSQVVQHVNTLEEDVERIRAKEEKAKQRQMRVKARYLGILAEETK